jgi:GNAT superfamily N-acetyltransferase
MVDTVAILELYRQLVHPVAPDVHIDIRADHIEDIRADPHNFLFVLEANERVCGTVFLTLCLDPMHCRQPYALIEHFVVEESQRGKGFGEKLARYVENFCREADCSRIMLLSNSKRKDAHAFFIKQGFHSDLKKAFVKYKDEIRTAIQ